MIRLIQTVILALIGVSSLISDAQAISKERLTIGISQYPSTLHPAFDSMLAKTYVVAMTRRPITAYDPDWKQVCLLCTSLPSLDQGTAVPELTQDGQEGLAVQYELLPDAVWGDGTPITTQDILFSVEMGKDPASGVDNAEQYRRIDRVEIDGDKRFTLHLNKRTCDYQGLSGLTLLPRHIEKPIFDQGAAEYRQRTAYDTDSTNPGLWHGPYRIAKVTPGQSILLQRNPEWWGKSPYFDEIEIRAIENTAALTANLLAGDIDMIAGELGLSVDQALAFQERYGDDYQIIFKPSLVYEHIDLNLDNPILKDVRVRQALLYGIDRSLITERLFKGKQPVAQSNVNPLDIRYDPDIPHYAYDPDKAAGLLDQAGWVMGADGIRQKDGTALSLTLQTTAGNKSRELVQQVLQNQWKQIGIDIRIENEPPRVLFGDTISKRRYPAMAMYAWMSAPESVPRTTLHSQEIPQEANAWAGQNYPGYASPEMDKIIDGLEFNCDEAQQDQLWTQMQQLYVTDLPVLPLYFRSDTYILPKTLSGLTPTGHQFPSPLWVEDWHLVP